MAGPQIIKTPGGEELVVLPRAEYEALVAAAAEAEEDAADIAIYDQRKTDLASGHDTRLPSEVCARVLQGDRLIRALREWRGMSLAQLAHETQVDEADLSDLESGRQLGAPETLRAISEALKIDPAWILREV